MSLNPACTYALCTILPCMATLTLLARMRVRVLQKSKLQIDDWTACGGMVVMWPITALILTGTSKRFFGTHTLQDPSTGAASRTPLDSENVEYMQIILILSILAIGLIKLSVVFLYRRIFSISRGFNMYSAFLITLIVLWTIALLGANIFQCGTHPAAAWTSAKQILQYCDDTSGATAALALSDLIMDIMIVVAPMPIVWGLKMNMKQRVQVLGIFGLGFVATAASAVRAYIFLYDSYGTTLSYRDIQGENTKIVVWTLVEIVAALMGSCFPTLRPLFANSSFGSILGSLFSVLTFNSRGSRHSRQGREEDRVHVVTIGGSEPKNVAASEKESKGSSSDLSDVGNLA